MKHVHRMPHGAALQDDGRVRFRLWAPSARSVALQVADRPAPLPLEPLARGWYEIVTDTAGPGSRYQFLIDGEQLVPDPASRFQPEDADGPSEVIDPAAFPWPQDGWLGRPWEETVLYELHVGSFSPEGTFDGVAARLDALQALGITAIELMPVADFAGRRGWGYDGVLPYAPDSRYGRPEDLKALVAACHARGLMIFLDVVYNHFGPQGNYLSRYATSFFTDRHQTPWGAAINFDGPDNGPVRDFFEHNALYWLLEYRFDGLRFDAVHAIRDDSGTAILDAIATGARAAAEPGRHIHLVLENDDNEVRWLARAADGRPAHYTAQWNDDFHHAAHVLLTGERDGYYADYADRPAAHLARCLAEGFAFQGEPSRHREGAPRGTSSAGLPPLAFVNFLQNHDQVGNRAFGERLAALTTPDALSLATALLLLAPGIPMLFMGEEWSAAEPFPYFCDFTGDLADAVREGRRREFARFPQFADPAVRESIPDPIAVETFDRARLDWSARDTPRHAGRLAAVRDLLDLRRREILPLLRLGWQGSSWRVHGEHALEVDWRFGEDGLHLVANPAGEPATGLTAPAGRCLWQQGQAAGALSAGRLPPWSGALYRTGADGR